jgi:hypothetical protein
MSFSFQKTSDQRSELALDGEPAYCRVWSEDRHLDTGQGVWLVLFYAAWSSPDRRAIPVALSVVKSFDGRVQLAIRKFSDHNELRAWRQEVKEKWASPVWLILRDGALLRELTGVRGDEELRAALDEAITQ